MVVATSLGPARRNGPDSFLAIDVVPTRLPRLVAANRSENDELQAELHLGRGDGGCDATVRIGYLAIGQS